MISVVPYKADHFAALLAQDGMAYLGEEFSLGQAKALEGTHAFTALAGETVLCCAGVVEYWPNRGEAWAFVSPHIKPYMVAVTCAVRRFLRVAPIRRIEAGVVVGFDEGIRWVRALGFQPASPWPMKAYKPDGTDCWLYYRVN